MKRKAIIPVVALCIGLILTACVNTAFSEPVTEDKVSLESKNKTESESKPITEENTEEVETEKKEPWDLTGSWWEDSVSRGEPGMAAFITDSEITVYHVSNNAFIRTPFWIGTYESRTGEDSFSWVSEKTESNSDYPFLSEDDAKEFTYGSGELSFPTSSGGNEIVRKMVRADYDFSEDYHVLPDEAEESSIEIGQYEVLIPKSFGFYSSVTDYSDDIPELYRILSNEAVLLIQIQDFSSKIDANKIGDSAYVKAALNAYLDGFRMGMENFTLIDEKDLYQDVGFTHSFVFEGTTDAGTRAWDYISVVFVPELGSSLLLSMIVPESSTYDYGADNNYVLEHITLDEESRKTIAFSKLNSKEDKVTQSTYYIPKAYPEYTNIRTYVLPYIATKGDQSELHLKANYYGNEWVMWNKLIFAIDDEPRYEMRIKLLDTNNTNIDNNGKVVESHVFSPLTKSDIDTLKKIVTSEETIIRFDGDGRQYDLTVSDEDKQAIKDVLSAYEVLN